MTYPLQIVSPDGVRFDGQAVQVVLPTMDGPVGILAQHINYVTALGTGRAKVITEQGERHAQCGGGMVCVSGGAVRVIASVFQWE